MSSFADLLGSRLERLRQNPDRTWQARCPACAAEGCDTKGEHLRVWPSGAFRCAKVGDARPHNLAIRAFLYEGADGATLAALQTHIVDPEPKLEADKVYPESMLGQMLPDHSYWIGRGISEDVLRRLEGGLHPPDVASKMSGRYLFPIRDHVSGRIVGWTGRLVSEASFGPTHKHLCRVSKVVYPLWYTRAAIERARKAVLIEGVGDQLAVMTAGIPYVITLLGLNLSSRLLGYLAAANLDEVVISTNSDTERVNAVTGAVSHPGQDAAAKIYARLVPYLGEKRVRIRLPVTRKDWCKTLEDGTGELEVFKAELEGRAPLSP